MGEKKKKELKAINPMLFLVAIILIVAVASYIVPAGSYDRVYDAAIDREIVDPSSYHTVDRNPVSPFMLLMSVSLGIQNAAYIITFLLVIGGMFAILNGTKAIETGIGQRGSGHEGQRAADDSRVYAGLRLRLRLLRQL